MESLISLRVPKVDLEVEPGETDHSVQFSATDAIESHPWLPDFPPEERRSGPALAWGAAQMEQLGAARAEERVSGVENRSSTMSFPRALLRGNDQGCFHPPWQP